MTTRLRNRLRFGLIFALVATLVTWLMLGENSPLEGYFLFHVAIANLVLKLLVVPYSVVMVLRPLIWADAISYALIFLQWLIVGFLFSLVFFRRSN
jgi:hypothetical protein